MPNSGDTCTVPCPVAVADAAAPCSGRGVCFAQPLGEGREEGRCICGSGSCGEACADDGDACAAVWCPDGWYGVGCLARCPGVSAQRWHR
eukprot:gene54373-biopygen75496